MPTANLDVKTIRESALQFLQLTGRQRHQRMGGESSILASLSRFRFVGSPHDHADELPDEESQPPSCDPRQGSIGQGMAHLLQEPEAAVDGCKNPSMQAEIDDSLEMEI